MSTQPRQPHRLRVLVEAGIALSSELSLDAAATQPPIETTAAAEADDGSDGYGLALGVTLFWRPRRT